MNYSNAHTPAAQDLHDPLAVFCATPSTPCYIPPPPSTQLTLCHPYLHSICQLEHNPQCNTTPPTNGCTTSCHPLRLKFGNDIGWTRLFTKWQILQQHLWKIWWTPSFRMQCNYIPLPHSNNSTTGTIALAVDMIQIMNDTTVYGICANQIITHL